MNGTRLDSLRVTRRICGGLSESTLRRLIAAGRFPRPVVLGRNRHGRPVRIAWIHEELVDWVRDRISADRE